MILLSTVIALSALSPVSTTPNEVVRRDISVSTGPDERARASLTVLARCGKTELRITSQSDGGTGPNNPSTKLTLDGKTLAIQGTALADVLRRGNGMRRYVPFCERSNAAIKIRFYSVTRPGNRIIYSVGSFTVNGDGGTTFHGEEQVSPEDFWLG